MLPLSELSPTLLVIQLASKKARDIMNQHKKTIKEIDGRKVEAGWFETARYKATGEKDAGKAGQSIAVVARANEFGTGTIPARPFMRLAATNFSRDRVALQAKIIKKMSDGKISADQALGQIGLAMEGNIASAIKDGNWVENAPSTAKAKGFNKPLIETAQMFQSVSSKVT
jgi:hypothetical protein